MIAGRHRLSIPRRVRVPPKVLIGFGLVAVLLVGGWFWFRDSSLVQVRRVTVSGTSGPDAGRIISALRAAALNMTTLDVDTGALDMAVAPFAVVKRLEVAAKFPHAMRIRVVEQNPVAAVTVGGHAVAVAADGTLLRDVTATAGLPAVPLIVPPVGPRLTDATARAEVAVLGAAPYALLAHVASITQIPGHGITAQLQNGPQLVFGDTTRVADKWLAATQVLADAAAKGASYIDLTDPARPAAGAGSLTSGSTTSGGATTATSGG